MRRILLSGKLAFAVCLFYLYTGPTLAQKGMPAKQIATASVTTNFPQHEDFKESMIGRLSKKISGVKINNFFPGADGLTWQDSAKSDHLRFAKWKDLAAECKPERTG